MRLHEGSILEKAFWRMIFATRVIKEVVKFLRTFFMVVKVWFLIIHRGGSIPDKVNNSQMDEMFHLWRKAADPEMQELLKIFIYKKNQSINDKQIN